MKRLTNYLAQHILHGTLLATILLVGIEHFLTLMNELKYVGTGHYGLLQVMTYLLFLLPEKIYQLFPMAMLLGSIMGMGTLAAYGELLAIRAAGVSYWQIVTAVLKIGFLLSLIVALIGELLVPVCERVANHHRAFSLTGGQALLTDNGTWMRDGNTFVHIHELSEMGHLQGVTRYAFGADLQLEMASYAYEAQRKEGGWELIDVYNTYFQDLDQVETEHTLRQFWSTRLDPEVLRVVGLKTLDQLPLRGLFKAWSFRRQNNLEVIQYELAFFEKLLRPFTNVIMLLLGVMCVFGPLRQAHFGLRMMVGILLGFSFFILHEIVSAMGTVYQCPPWIAVSITPLVFGVLGMTLLRRLKN